MCDFEIYTYMIVKTMEMMSSTAIILLCSLVFKAVGRAIERGYNTSIIFGKDVCVFVQLDYQMIICMFISGR